MEVIDNLYIGGDDLYNTLKNNKDFDFIRVCKFGKGSHKDLLKYDTQAAPEGKDQYSVKRGRLLAINLLDLDDHNYIPWDAIKLGIITAKNSLKAGRKVLVSDNAGKNRAPIFALMLMKALGEFPHTGFAQAEKVISFLYGKYEPKQGMRQFAKDHWHELEQLEG